MSSKLFSRALFALLVCGGLVAIITAPKGTAPVQAADVTHCGARIAVLGSSLTGAARFEVQKALRVGPHTVQIDQTAADAQAQAHGTYPAALLGSLSISSALLHPLPAGTGLDVTLNQGIGLDTAGTYANALLTAGITDAEIRIAAPLKQKTLGVTALLNLLRAGHIACLKLNPVREQLAMREIVLTSQMVLAGKRTMTMPILLHYLKQDAVTKHIVDTAALAALVKRDETLFGVPVPAQYRSSLITFLHDLAASGTFGGVAAAHPAMVSLSPYAMTVRLHPPGSQAAGHKPTVPVPASPVATAAAMAPLSGTIVAATGAGLSLKVGAVTQSIRPVATGLQVTRNGQRSTLGALRPGDKVRVTRDSAGRAIAVVATSAIAAPVVRQQIGTTAPANAPNMAAITVLAVLVLLVLLVLPLLAGLLRRRRGQMTPAGAGASASASGGAPTATDAAAADEPTLQVPRADDDDE